MIIWGHPGGLNGVLKLVNYALKISDFFSSGGVRGTQITTLDAVYEWSEGPGPSCHAPLI